MFFKKDQQTTINMKKTHTPRGAGQTAGMHWPICAIVVYVQQNQISWDESYTFAQSDQSN